ncbi:hypothetical protein A1O3_01261 [Capronia epimyces CBS 606.96]|uniref:Uncharacterized protein n=1 Tax=Capronia epimyces CBS 606.96 TaxID=1182542 RepID=W9ZDV5_9EURO|nr:uncharacterized protein A1O3_01261 [Capronia epimyces CBS 606.96]EXJ92709.1 hypothetical protein A1O3_01261 [Capronia epimyces CBS 606.96]
MPTAHGLTVSVVTANGHKFPEYGHQNLRGSTARSKTVSSKIQAKDGQTFCIMVDVVKKSSPHHEKGKHALTSLSKESGGMGSSRGRYNLRSSLKQDGVRAEQKEKDCEGKGALQQVSSGKLPFTLVAWVYIDGNKVPECSQILYTEPNLSPYVLRGRYTAASKGQKPGDIQQDIVIQEWVFTPVGIDVLLSKMDIAAPDPEPPANAIEEELDEVIQGLAEVNAVKRPKSGQIEVRITRIVDLGHGPRSDWSRKEQQRAKEDAEGTHTVSICEPQRTMRVKTCAWRPYDETEEYYAKFIFQYMGIEKLVNLGLCTADGKSTKQLQLEARASPLSSLPNSAGSQASPLKSLKGSNKRKGDKVESSGRPWSSDEEGKDGGDTSSSDDSDRPRKRHETALMRPMPRTLKKLIGSQKKKDSSLSLLPNARHHHAGQSRMQLVIRAGRNGGGAEDHGSKLELVEPGQGKDDHVQGSELALVEVEAENGGEDKIE